jgi:hypothetical protein
MVNYCKQCHYHYPYIGQTNLIFFWKGTQVRLRIFELELSCPMVIQPKGAINRMRGPTIVPCSLITCPLNDSR